MVATGAAQGWQAFLSSAALWRDSVGSRLKAVEAVRSHSVGRSCTLERQGGIQTALHEQRILSSQYSCHQRYSLVESPSQWLLQQRRHCHHNQSTVLLSALSLLWLQRRWWWTCIFPLTAPLLLFGLSPSTLSACLSCVSLSRFPLTIPTALSYSQLLSLKASVQLDQHSGSRKKRLRHLKSQW